MRLLSQDQTEEWEEWVENLRWPTIGELAAISSFVFAFLVQVNFELSNGETGYVEAIGLSALAFATFFPLVFLGFGGANSLRIRYGALMLPLMLEVLAVALAAVRFYRPLMQAESNFLFAPEHVTGPGLVLTAVFFVLMVITLPYIRRAVISILDNLPNAKENKVLPIMANVIIVIASIVFAFIPFSIG